MGEGGREAPVLYTPHSHPFPPPPPLLFLPQHELNNKLLSTVDEYACNFPNVLKSNDAIALLHDVTTSEMDLHDKHVAHAGHRKSRVSQRLTMMAGGEGGMLPPVGFEVGWSQCNHRMGASLRAHGPPASRRWRR